MPKWAPLTSYLLDAEQDRLTLSLGDIEDILGAPLPPSARRHRSIVWSNSDSNPYARIWRSAGYRTSLRGLSVEHVAFVREGVTEPAGAPGRGDLDDTTVVLVGCVKTKAAESRAAKDLYLSTLFRRRRAYAERSGKPWLILSAHHGVVHPDDVIGPYDVYLDEQPAAYRHEWAGRVVDQLCDRFDDIEGQVFEFHASAAYVQPLVPLLREAGARAVWPFESLTFGEHLGWYTGGEAPSSGEDPQERVTGLVGNGARRGLARRISAAFTDRTMDVSLRTGAPEPGWEGLPEVRAARELRGDGASAEQVRLLCTFVTALSRARNAAVLWRRAVETFRAAAWVFDPDAVAGARQSDLTDALRACQLSQRTLADTAAWRVIGESLARPDAAPAAYRAVRQGRGHARELLRDLQRTSAAGTPLFPLLRAPDLGPVWVRMLAYPGEARISALELLPLAVDVDVRKVSEYLDVSRTRDMPIDRLRPLLQRLWRDDVAEHDPAGPGSLAHTPAALEAALRFMGKWGCSWCERLERKEPVTEACAACRFEQVHGPDRTGGRAREEGTEAAEGGPSTAREEILEAARVLTRRGAVPFSPAQLIHELRRRGSAYPDSTLRTHIVAAMCVNAPHNHAVRYPDLERVGRGQYRLYEGDA